jgi:phenylacetic acid degradation operon negative regulatory protein
VIQSRNSQSVPEAALTARSVLASTLLGTKPPRLPVGHLVRAGALFGIAEGTVRTALSRMASAGEVEADEGWYRLSGRLLDRQRRQDDSRAAARVDWHGGWWLAVVREGRRPAPERAGLRAAAVALRFGELREGVWLRPANLDPHRLPRAAVVLDAQCHRFGVAEVGELEPTTVWDLDGWTVRAQYLQQHLDELVGRLDDGDTGALAPGFVLSADVLRHFQADPLLPDELLPNDWPGPSLRQHYDRYDRSFRVLLRRWFATNGRAERV